MSPAAEGAPGVGEGDAEVRAAALAYMHPSVPMGDPPALMMRDMRRALEAAAKARTAVPGPDRGEAERLRAEIEEVQLSALRDVVDCIKANERAAAAEARAGRAEAALRRCEWAGERGGRKVCCGCGAYAEQDGFSDPPLPMGVHRDGCPIAGAIGDPAVADPAATGPAPGPSDLAAGRAAVRRDALEAIRNGLRQCMGDDDQGNIGWHLSRRQAREIERALTEQEPT